MEFDFRPLFWAAGAAVVVAFVVGVAVGRAMS